MIGATAISEVTREDCRTLIAACRDKGLSPKMVAGPVVAAEPHGRVPREEPVLDGLRQDAAEGPADVLDALRPEIRPLTREEASQLLAAAREHYPREYPLLLCALRTGLRLGELLGLQWGDVDFHGRFLEVRRNLVAGRLTTPKNGKSRRVDMSRQLKETLRELLVARKADALRRGWGRVPDWLFCTEGGGAFDGDNLRHRVFYKVLEKAQLRRVRFHDLRHYPACRIIPFSSTIGLGDGHRALVNAG